MSAEVITVQSVLLSGVAALSGAIAVMWTSLNARIKASDLACEKDRARIAVLEEALRDALDRADTR